MAEIIHLNNRMGGRYILGKGDRAKWRDQLGRPGAGENRAYIHNSLLTPIRKSWIRAAFGISQEKNLAPELLGRELEDINTSGGKYIGKDDQGNTYFTPVDDGHSKRVKGCVGLLTGADRPYYFDLDLSTDFGEDPGQAKRAIAHHVLDIVPKGPRPNDKLIVKTRRMLTSGNEINASRFFYRVDIDLIKLRNPARYRILSQVDFRDADTRVLEDGALVRWTPAGRPDKTVTIPIKADELVDIYGKTLFDNGKMGITGTDDIYQREYGSRESLRSLLAVPQQAQDRLNGVEIFREKEDHPEETREFRPMMDRNPDSGLFLRMDLVKRSGIAKPDDLKELEKTGRLTNGYRIMPSAAYSALKVNGKWLPVNEVIPKGDIDREKCGFMQAETVSIVNQQNRVGYNKDQIEFRDIYFHGLEIRTNPESRREYGSNFGLNFAKGLHQEGINAGRGGSTAWWAFMLPQTEIKETNNPYQKKLIENDTQSTSVSEDEKFKQAALAPNGLVLEIVKVPFDTHSLLGGDLMTAEQKPGNWGNQGPKRYAYSERLFIPRYNYFVRQEISKRIGRDPLPELISPERGAEIAAGRFWFKYPFALITQLIAPIVYVGTGELVPWMPFDRYVVVATWVARTVFSPLNFIRSLMSLGYRAGKAMVVGFGAIPQIEYTVLADMFRTACRQYLDRNQWANFVLTSAGGRVTMSKAKFAVSVSGLAATAATFTFVGVPMLIGGAPIAIWVTSFFLMVQSAQFIANIGYMWAANKGAKKQSEINREIAQKKGLAKLGASAVNSVSNTFIPKKILQVKALPEGQYSFNDIRARSSKGQRQILTYEQVRDHVNSLENGVQTNLRGTLANVADPYGHITYNDLIVSWGRIKSVLLEMGAIDKRGIIRINEFSPIKDVGVEMLNLFSKIENLINAKAKFDLKRDPACAAARQAVKFVADNSGDFAAGYIAEQIMTLAGMYVRRR